MKKFFSTVLLLLFSVLLVACNDKKEEEEVVVPEPAEVSYKYISNADYTTIFGETTKVNFDLAIPKVATPVQNGMGMIIPNLKLSVEATYNMATYESAELHARINISSDIMNMVFAGNESSFGFKLIGGIDIYIKDSKSYVNTHVGLGSEGSTEPDMQLSSLMMFAGGFIPPEAKPLVDVIMTGLNNSKEYAQIDFSKDTFKAIKTLAPMGITFATQNLLKQEAIKDSNFNIKLENDLMEISKSAPVFNTEFLKNLGFIPESIINLISSVQDINIKLDNKDETFNSLELVSNVKIEALANEVANLSLKIKTNVQMPSTPTDLDTYDKVYTLNSMNAVYKVIAISTNKVLPSINVNIDGKEVEGTEYTHYIESGEPKVVVSGKDAASGTDLVGSLDSGTVDWNTAGVYDVVYSVKDLAGNTQIKRVKITVAVDDVEPSISVFYVDRKNEKEYDQRTAETRDYIIDKNTVFEIKLKIEDNADKNPTIESNIIFTPEKINGVEQESQTLEYVIFNGKTALGTYKFSVKATDQNGNVAEREYTIIVKDEAPKITQILVDEVKLSEDKTTKKYKYEHKLNDTKPTITIEATDNISEVGDLVITQDGSKVEWDKVGTYEYKITVADEKGYTLEKILEITVVE